MAAVLSMSIDQMLEGPQDMDLIDVLWRQDIDLGVGREMFDLTLRKELEQERERELHKQQEEELLALEKNAVPPDDVSYIIDSETGEMIVAPLDKNDSIKPPVLEPEEGLSVETMLLLQETTQLSIDTVPNVPAPHTQAAPPTQESFTLELDTFLQSAPHIPNAVSHGLAEFGRQNSFEQRWQDVSSLLSLDTSLATTSTGFFSSQPEPMTPSTPPYPENALVQNATLPLNINQGEMQQQGGVFGSLQQDSFTAPSSDDYTNTTLTSLLSPNNASHLVDAADIFPNLTQPTVVTDAGSLLDHSLLELLDATDNMNDVNMAHLDPYLTPYGTQPRTNSPSSDSAISMTESLTMEHETSNVSSLCSMGAASYEGLEGATGGSDDSGASGKSPICKQEPYNSSDYSMDDYSFQTASIQTNHSYNSNMSSNPPPSPTYISRQAEHNHTYPLQPGQSSRDRASPTVTPTTGNSSVGVASNSKRAAIEKPAHVTREMRKLKEAKLPLTVEDITESSVEVFNEMLQRFSLTERQLQLVRDIRRRGKNKVAAQNCRKRKMEVVQTIEDELAGMKAQRDELVRQRRSLQREMGSMKSKFGGLYDEVFNSLRDEDGKPYDPAKYVLKQTDDGNVFLIPKTEAPVEAKKGHKTKGSRKRKSHRSDV